MNSISILLYLYFMRCRNSASRELIFSRFLLERFHMDSLVTKTKRKDVRNALETLPPELDGSYDQTIERIEGQGKDYSRLARRVLLWVSNTSRPLSPVELQYAIAVQPGMTALDDEDLDDQDLMVSVCAGLVVLDAETNTLRFVRKFILFIISEIAISVSAYNMEDPVAICESTEYQIQWSDLDGLFCSSPIVLLDPEGHLANSFCK